VGGSARAEEQARAELLRGVLDLALGVARADAAHDPSTVPAELRSVVRHAKVVPRARAAADRAGADDAFRARIAEAVDPEELSPAERLWLERPAGWQESLGELVADRAAEAEEGDARRALAREQRARRSAEEARDRARADLERVRADLGDLRDEVAAVRAAAAEAAQRAERAEADRSDAVRRLKDLEAAHARLHEQRREERAATQAASRPAEASTSSTSGEPASGAPTPQALPRPPAAGTPDEGPGPPAPGDAPPAAASDVDPRPPAEGVDPAVARAVTGAASAAAALADSLAEVASLLGPDPTSAATSGDGRALPPGPDRRARPSDRRRRSADRRGAGRRPAPLPGGVHDDSHQAAAHLVRLHDAALLVDGYNASMAAWPDHPISEQRQRLLSALDGLEARIGVDTTVVFDGVEAAAGTAPGAGRVRVAFTDPEVEADDVILDLVDLLPAHRPVVVATDDRRVRDGARRRGANVIGITQLRSLLG
jgi:hypothetical protein